MIYGSGLIANRFKIFYTNDRNIYIYASGVSDSSCTSKSEFDREERLLREALKNRFQKFVYFSTCSIYDDELSKTAYVKHKLRMENILKDYEGLMVVRLPQLIGCTSNKSTVINFLWDHITNNLEFELWSRATRNLIDIDDVYKAVNSILLSPNNPPAFVNIANPFSATIQEIVGLMEELANKKARYINVDKGSTYSIDISLISHLYPDFINLFPSGYLKLVFAKYLQDVSN
jgi:nucleoside-diphosphate-sugar epimerase